MQRSEQWFFRAPTDRRAILLQSTRENETGAYGLNGPNSRWQGKFIRIACRSGLADRGAIHSQAADHEVTDADSLKGFSFGKRQKLFLSLPPWFLTCLRRPAEHASIMAKAARVMTPAADALEALFILLGSRWRRRSRPGFRRLNRRIRSFFQPEIPVSFLAGTRIAFYRW